MYNGLLGLHSLLRWLIILLLLINILRMLIPALVASTDNDKKWNLRLLIVAHVNLLIGLYQYFFGEKGFILFKENGAAVMKNAVLRFWAVEHITGMIIAIVLITISRSVSKKNIPVEQKNKKLVTFYIIALIIILASIPWPFRFEGMPWFRGLY
jgi:uncharacterized membrane protein